MFASRTLKLYLFALCGLLLVVTSGLFGQAPVQGSDQPREITLKGTVEKVAIVPAYGATDTHVKLKTGSQLVDVNLGPTRWLDRNQFSIATGDNLQIVGSRVKSDSGEVFTAREVTSGDQHLELQGRPGTWASSGGPGRGYCRGMGCGGDGYGCGGYGCRGYAGNGGYCPGCGAGRGGCRGAW